MNNKIKAILLAAGTALVLAGCGGGSNHNKSVVTVDENSDFVNNGDLYYAYPANNQQDITTKTSIILGYMDPVNAEPGDYELTTEAGDPVEMDAGSFKLVTDGYKKLVPNGNSVVMRPAADLDTDTVYKLRVTDQGKAKGLKLPTGHQKQSVNGELTFTTRPDFRGSAASRSSFGDASTFTEKYYSPTGEKDDPFVDFSSITFSMTQQIDPATVRYGELGSDQCGAEGCTVELRQNGELVEATVLSKEQYLTIDPKNHDCSNEPAEPGKTSGAVANHCERDTPDLTPGQPVTITITDGLKSVNGAKFVSSKFNDGLDLTPQDSTPRGFLVLDAPVANERTNACFEVEGNEVIIPDDTNVSSLSGSPINCVPLFSPLLGENPLGRHTESAQAGTVYTTLAAAPKFADYTPLRIKKSALLKGGALDVFIGGEVNMILSSGDVSVTWLSDANGVMSENPYTANPKAPKQLIITADMTFDTVDPRTNGAFTQNLQHVTLIGMAIGNPHSGELSADAIGAIEPNVIAADTAFGLLAFHMDSYPHQNDLPAGVDRFQPDDPRDLYLIDWTPGAQFGLPLDNKPDPGAAGNIANPDSPKVAKLFPPVAKQADPDLGFGADKNVDGEVQKNIADDVYPTDPIILNFNKPVDKDSINPNGNGPNNDVLRLLHNGQPVGYTWLISGASLVIQPDEPLEYSTADEDSTYEVDFEGLEDFRGTKVVDRTNVTFTMPAYDDDGGPFDAVVTSTYPGFPCVTDPGSLKLASLNQGYCESNPADGKSSAVNGGRTDMDGNDLPQIPVQPMPANRGVQVNFSQMMDADSLADAFVVEACDGVTADAAAKTASADSCANPTPVDGDLDVNGPVLRFTPAENWEEGQVYRYRLHGETAQTERGAKLATNMLNALEVNTGGGVGDRYDDMVVYFFGAPKSFKVQQLLRNMPTADTNANLKHDVVEREPAENVRALFNTISLGVKGVDGTLITGAEQICSETDLDNATCQNPQTSYVTASLGADIMGFVEAADVEGIDPDAPDIVKQNGGLLVYIYPSHLVISAATLNAQVLNLLDKPLATGALVDRMRYTCDAAQSDASADDYCDLTPDGSQGRIPAWIYNHEDVGVPRLDGQSVITITLETLLDAPELAPALSTGDLPIPGADILTEGLGDLLNGIGLGGILNDIISGLGLGSAPVVGDLVNALTNALDTAELPITSNLHAAPVKLALTGPVSMLPNGRLQVGLLNTVSADVKVQIDIAGLLDLIPLPGGGIGNLTLTIPVANDDPTAQDGPDGDRPAAGVNINYIGVPVVN